jgi:hypothetical protein
MYICIDFDGTCVKNAYPHVGNDIGAVPILKRIVGSGNKLILHTMRSRHNGTLQDALKWFEDNEIPIYSVNSNPTQRNWTDSGKVFAQLYIDDAALGAPLIKSNDGSSYIDWTVVEKLLESEGII